MLLKDRLLRVLPEIEQCYPRCRWIFLTLTLCSYNGELGSTELSVILKSWQRLLRRREFYRVVLGWVRTTSFKEYNGIIYPYYQALLLVSPEYFGRWYVSNWAEIWRQCARVNYTPVVDTRVVVDCGEFVKTMECPVENRLTATGGVLRRLLRK
jgi:hypothetical protein